MPGAGGDAIGPAGWALAMAVAAIAAGLAWRQWREGLGRESELSAEDAWHFDRQDIRRYTGAGLMALIAAAVAIGSAVDPRGGGDRHRIFVGIWAGGAGDGPDLARPRRGRLAGDPGLRRSPPPGDRRGAPGPDRGRAPTSRPSTWRWGRLAVRAARQWPPVSELISGRLGMDCGVGGRNVPTAGSIRVPRVVLNPCPLSHLRRMGCLQPVRVDPPMMEHGLRTTRGTQQPVEIGEESQ